MNIRISKEDLEYINESLENGEVLKEDLKRWFKEKWVDVSRKVGGKHPPCGRSKASTKGYPKCRPSKKVSKETPKTAGSYSKNEKKSMTSQKRRAEKKEPKLGKGNKPTFTRINEDVTTNNLDKIYNIFESIPELSNIGTPEQYSEYLNTIFPDSKMKDIVYHGTDNPNFSGFGADFKRGIHFGTLQSAKDRRIHTDFEFKNNAQFIPALLNIKNPLKTEIDFNFEGEGLEFEDSPDFDFTKEQGHRLLITYLYNKGYNVYHPQGGAYTDGEILKNAGLDSVVYKNEREDKGNYSFAVFEPEKIHILGSEKDINGFKNYVNQQKINENMDNNLQNKLVELVLDEIHELHENRAPRLVLRESMEIISEGLMYHINNNKPLTENVYRIYSNKFFQLFNEARDLYKSGSVEFFGNDLELLKTDIGKVGLYEGQYVFLDVPFIDGEENHLVEAKHRGKNVKLNKPFRTPGGPKKFAVYVKSPGGNVKKVTFGDPNLRVRNSNKKAAKSFRARHKCDQKKDRTTAGYWSCNLSRYRKALGIKSSRSW